MKIRAVFLVNIFLLAAIVSAAPQWLNYCTSDSARDILSGSTRNVELSSTKPDGLQLPELKCDSPRFAKWSHKMADEKPRQIILDRQKKYGKYDIMYFDSNGDGAITADEQYTGKPRDEYNVYYYGIPAYFETTDGQVTYHLNFYFYSYRSDYERLYIQNGCWYESHINIDGTPTKCMLIDSNLNGSFNDISENFDSDRVIIGDGDDKFETRVGKYLEYKNKLYELNVAKDGAYIELAFADNVNYGQLEIPTHVSTFVCGGTYGMFRRDNITDGKVSLPVGQYKVRSWNTSAKDSAGKDWLMGATWYSNDNVFEVKDYDVARIDAGKTVFSTLNVSFNNGAFNFNHQLAGNNGESVTLTKSGNRPDAPKIRIYNRDRTYDRTFSLEYG